MADTKDSALTAATSVALTDGFAIVQSGASKYATFGILKQGLGAGYRNASTSTVSAGYSADTYLAGSSVVVPAGAWAVSSFYVCAFEMVKTAAGTATFTINTRMGSLGTTGDTNRVQFVFGAGTAAVDTGIFEVLINFRTVGATTVMQGVCQCTHHLAATGLVSTGASGTGIIIAASGSFNSAADTTIGLSVNGGASFSGTNTLVQAYVIL